MTINKHGSFYIRNGWPTKILTAVRENPNIFSPNNELLAVDSIGMGRVMIKALRYWAKVMGLVNEVNQQGLTCIETPLFIELYNNDIYFQDKGSLWLLHRELTTNKEDATAWYWAFNEYDKSSFTKNDFVSAFHAYIIKNGATNNVTAVEKEFDCFKNTYASDGIYDVQKVIEENTVPFFSPLSLIKYKGNGIYEKQKLNNKNIPIEIFYYCILKDNEYYLENNRQIGLEKLLEEPCQVCKYLNISYATLIEMLQILENQGKVKLFNNFGNRHIEIPNNNYDDLLHDYFQMIGR